MAQNNNKKITRERILDKAEALFAQKGFHAVSVREITKIARCNLAAVNYHFGNKHNLYLEVFRARWVPRAMRVRKSFEKSLAAHDEACSLADVVEALAKAFIEGPLSDDERQRHHQLMARELGRPTEAFELIASQVLRPFFRELAGRFSPFMPEELEEERLMLKVLSIFGTVLYFNFARVAVTRITGCEYDSDFKARLVEHITEFALKGLGVDEKERKR